MKSKTIQNWRKKSKDMNNFINKENNVFLDNEILYNLLRIISLFKIILFFLQLN